MAAIELTTIKDDFDKDYVNNQTTRINAADDLLFCHVSQWDQSLIESSQLGYKGQFDIVTKAIRENMSDLRTNQVSVEFEPKADSRDAEAD